MFGEASHHLEITNQRGKTPFLAVLPVVSVYLLVEVFKGGSGEPKRTVYFRENLNDKIRWHSWSSPKVSVKVEFDIHNIFSRAFFNIT